MTTDLMSFEIPTWTEPATLEYLADLASKSKFAVEIGCYMGASARFMLKASQDLHLWTGDKWDVFGTKQITQLFLNEWIERGQCELIVGDSTVMAQMLSHMKGKIDFCFVDDGHQEWQVLADINNFLPLLKPGGQLLGHDFDSNPFNDVAQGVISSGISYDIPVPRLWRHIKPK